MTSTSLVSPFSVVWALLSVLALLFFFLAFLVIWLDRRQQLQTYFIYGLSAGLTVVGLNFLIILFRNNSVLMPESRFSLFFGMSMNFIKMLIFTTVGMDYSAELRYPSFPFFSRLHSDISIVGNNVSNRRNFLIHTLVITIVSILYSLALFKVTDPEMGAAVRQMMINNEVSQSDIFSPASFSLGIVFAFNEEITFRLGIQNFLAKHLNWRHDRYAIAIIVTSSLWTIGHAGALSPDWVKFAQIFPVGLSLGWLFRKYGVESCILAHSLFNITLLSLTTQLVHIS